MTLNLDDYREELRRADPAIADTLDGIFHEAARVLSPAGLEEYLNGARALAGLGRGRGIVISYLEEMPAVARECGEDILRDVVEAALKLSSMTSGEVIAQLIATLPTAARRLGDPELLRGYLGLVHQLSARAARGLRPMLAHMDELLGKLTLGGLRRWALFGAEAYRRDLPNLQAYFNLETADSRAVLRRERRGTLFVDTQRKLNFYLRALWGRDFFLRPTSADHEGFKPSIEQRVLHLPDALDGLGGVGGGELYRATAAHMAAHMVYTRSPLSAEQLSPAQMFFIGLLEDARVEQCAIAEFPGLQRLWGSLMAADYPGGVEHPSVLLLERLAHRLLEPSATCDDAELDAFADRFHAAIAGHRLDRQFSWRMGMELFQLFAARREVPSLRILQSIRVPYRDDNRHVWEFSGLRDEGEIAYVPASQRQVRRTVSAIEMAHEVDCEFAGDDAQEIWTCATELFPYEDAGVSYNEMWGREPVSEPYHYPEWDYQVQLPRPDWATVYERRQPRGNPEAIEAILAEHRPIAQRIRHIIDQLTPAGVQRMRNLVDGDEIDLNAAVDAMVAIRMGEQPSPRITMRNVIRRRDLAVVVLLDLSESTNETATGSDRTILQLTREAATLLATAIEGIGDPFAIHGFASDGRHDVQYYRFKEFARRFDDDARSRLAGMQGGLSTRMGAAMRHAGHHLLRQPEQRKLLLLVTDGEPADVDERDPQYLRHDARKAVEELHTRGVQSYCLTLDPDADHYVRRIFGERNYTIVDQVQRLPEKLPALFASLTR